MKKFYNLKYLFFIILFISLAFVLYELRLQKLVNEGVDIINQQCKVFASLHEQNKIFKESIQILLTPDSKDAYLKKLDDYYKISKQNVAEQEKWLSTQKRFINRWDYKLLPSNIQELGILRYQYWKLDNEAQSVLIDSYDIYQLNDNLSNELALKSKILNKDRDSMQKKIDLIWKTYKDKPDWKMMFIKVPQSSC